MEVASGEKGDEAGVEIEIAPRVMGSAIDPTETERIVLRGYRAETQHRGFFQIAGIAPGGYELRARREGFSSPGEIFVEVVESRESALEEPLALEPLAALEIFVDPPVDPYGQAWTLTLLRQREDSYVLQEVAQHPASESGSWSEGGLDSGSYRISVTDSTRATWFDEPIEVTTRDAPRWIEIPIVPIEGRVRIGKEPLEATVVFGTTQGRPSIHARTDEDGLFEGFLPREGVWPLEVLPEHDTDRIQAVEPVEVEREPGQRVAFVDISLPDTVVRGRVVDGEAPVAQAGILMIRNDGEVKRREVLTASKDDGRFELRGLSPGQLHVRAEHRGKTSEWRQIEVQEDLEAPELILNLAGEITLRGHVLSPAGAVAGANVAAIPVTSQPELAMLEQATTSADGSFSLSLPATTSQIDVVVIAPGWPVRIARHAIEPAQPLTLALAPTRGDLRLGETPSNPKNQGRMGPRVLRHGGSELDLRWLFKLLPSGHLQSTVEGLVLRGFESGAYELCRAGAGCDGGELSPGGELALDPKTLRREEAIR